MREVGGKVVFERRELAVRLELLDRLLHLLRTSAEICRAYDDYGATAYSSKASSRFSFSIVVSLCGMAIVGLGKY